MGKILTQPPFLWSSSFSLLRILISSLLRPAIPLGCGFPGRLPDELPADWGLCFYMEKIEIWILSILLYISRIFFPSKIHNASTKYDTKHKHCAFKSKIFTSITFLSNFNLIFVTMWDNFILHVEMFQSTGNHIRKVITLLIYGTVYLLNKVNQNLLIYDKGKSCDPPSHNKCKKIK